MEKTIGLDTSWEAQRHIPAYATHTETLISGFFGQYRFLSNFWPAEVDWDGTLFSSVEIAYQAAKCLDRADYSKFVGLTSAEAKQLGKRVDKRHDWEDVKKRVMRNLVTQKFANHPDLRKLLVDTFPKLLVEANAWKDRYWGEYYRFNYSSDKWESLGGENNLGMILMRIRAGLITVGTS